MKTDVEKILIASWLHGDNLEDMDMFYMGEFNECAPVFKAIMEVGVESPLQVMRTAGLEVSDFTELTSNYAPALYSASVDELFKDKAREWLEVNYDRPPEEIIAKMESLTRHEPELPEPAINLVGDLIAELDRRASEEIVGTGFSDLDKLLCGVRKKEFTCVGARPSVGKSAFMQQVATHIAFRGKKVLFFPLEMSKESIAQRMLCSRVNVSQYALKNGLDKSDWEKVTPELEKMQEFINEGNMLVFERCNDINTIRYLIKKHRPYAVFIDQLEQLKDGKKNFPDKRARFSYMTHELQAISLDEDVAVWLACQVNRGADDIPPTMANLKESGTIEEDATNVILLHRSSEKSEKQTIEVDLAKQKDGACGKIDLMFYASKFKFYGLGNYE